MKYNLIKQTLFYVKDENNKTYLLKDPEYNTYEEICKEDIKGDTTEEEIVDLDDRSYTIISYFKIK